MTNEEMDRAISGLSTKSDMIRKLNEMGVERAKIATYLNIRYQHVRNVLVAPAPAKTRAKSTTSNARRTLEDDGAPVRPLTIDDAKQGLAAHFGVDPSSIEIIIRG